VHVTGRTLKIRSDCPKGLAWSIGPGHVTALGRRRMAQLIYPFIPKSTISILSSLYSCPLESQFSPMDMDKGDPARSRIIQSQILKSPTASLLSLWNLCGTSDVKECLVLYLRGATSTILYLKEWPVPDSLQSSFLSATLGSLCISMR